MKLIFKINMLFAMLLLTACVQSTGGISDDAPQWVSGEPDMYPNSKYLYATGSASESEQAKARALSNLAKIFEVQVREVSTTSQDIQSNTREGVETVQKSQRINSQVNLHTDKMIQGARIAEQWQNSVDRSYHALAILDRSQAGNNIRGEINRLDEETQYALNQQKKRDNPLLAIADLQRANSLQQQRQALQKTLKIIDVRGRGLPATWSLAQLNETLQQALRTLPVQTRVTVDDIGGLQNILQGAVSSAGFVIGDRGYTLAAGLEVQPPIRDSDWYWLRGVLKLELMAEDGVSVIGYQSWPLKVSAGSESQLNARMLREVDKKLKQELLSSVIGFVS